MQSVVVKACSNIALVKYWGKRQLEGNIPAVGSVSIGLEDLWSRTRISKADAASHQICIDGALQGKSVERADQFVREFCAEFGKSTPLTIDSENNFPTGAGLASSASGFAALTMALNTFLDVGLEGEELARFARRGSGSAARSLFGGYVEMTADDDATARPLCQADYWPLDVIIAITQMEEKHIGSTEGMEHTARTSPYYAKWVSSHPQDMEIAREAILARDFKDLARVSEHSCLKMHAVMMSANPGLIYWNSVTLALIHHIRVLQEQGLGLFFTIDAGPQVKIICNPSDTQDVLGEIKTIPGVIQTRLTRVGGEPLIEITQ